MNFSDDIVRNFWREYHLASNKFAYKQLLLNAKLSFIELMENLEGEEFLTTYDHSPLLAMISEVQRVCPEAVEELANQENFFATAQEILSNYTEEKRDLLRDTFLKKPNTLFRFK